MSYLKKENLIICVTTKQKCFIFSRKTSKETFPKRSLKVIILGKDNEVKKYIFCTLLTVFFLTGCSYTKMPEKKPDDAVSEEFKKELDDKFVYLRHKSEGKNLEYYNYEIKSFLDADIGEFVKVCNDVSGSENIKLKFSVSFYNAVNSYSTMFFVSNYDSDDNIFDGIYYLRIYDQTQFSDMACNPELYSEIEGIRELHVAKAIQDKADDMGIDWYSYWPDLEKVVIEER